MAFFGGIGHRFFTEDMFPGLGGADGVFGVHAVGEDDVDDVDVGIVFDGVIVVVVVNIFGIDAIFGGLGLGFFGVTADEGDGTAEFGFGEGGEDLVHAERADADDGEAEFCLGGIIGDSLRP